MVSLEFLTDILETSTNTIFFFIILIGYLLYDNLSRFYHTNQIFYTDISDIFNRWTNILFIVSIGYLVIFLYYGLTLSNRILAAFSLVYISYSIVYSAVYYTKNPLNKMRKIPILILIFLPYFVFPASFIEIWNSVVVVSRDFYNLVEDNTLTFLAAFFSYLGWKYGSVDNRSDRENELSIHFRGNQFVDLELPTNQDPPEYHVNQVSVSEIDSIWYRMKKYTPFFGFKGRTIINLKQDQIKNFTEKECYYVASNFVYIHDLEKVTKDEVRITFSSAVPETVRTALEIWVIQLNDELTGTSSELGNKTPGKVEYFKPSNLISGLIYGGEIKNIRSVMESNNAGVMLRNQGEKPGVGILYHHENGWVRSYDRNIWYFLDLIRGIPLEKKGRMTPPPAGSYKPSFRGARRLKNIYSDVTVIGVSNRSINDIEYMSIDVKIEPEREDVGICHMIPINNYKFEVFNTPPVFSDRVSIQSLSNKEIDELVRSKLELSYIITENHRVSAVYSCSLNGEEYLVNINYTPWGDMTIFDIHQKENIKDPGEGVIWKSE